MNGITYSKPLNSMANRDGFTEILSEASSFFGDKGINMVSAQGFDEILTNGTLFEDYKGFLLQGLSQGEMEQYNQLLENAKLGILSEATTAGIQNIAGLVMPTIRKMWAKIALKHAMPTVVLESPRASISYSEAILIKGDKEYVLPTDLNKIDNDLAELPRLDKTPITLPADNFDLFSLAPVPASKELKSSIDQVFLVESVVMDVNGVDVTVRVNHKADLHQNINVSVVGVDPAHPDVKVVDTLLGVIDFLEGTISATSLKGHIKSVILNARLTQELNTQGESITFRINTRDIVVGTGAHINAPLPLEWLQDTMATYKIDGGAEVVDIMSQTVAQKLEIEIYNFLKKSIEVNNVPYVGQFDIRPSAGYAGRPKDWREELKTVIDYYANKMKKDSNFSQGKFVIIGSPIDTALLPNVNWSFNSGASDELAGVSVGFSLGAFSGANKYSIVSSDLLPDGELIMFFVPSVDRLMTYKYFPYTFNISKGEGYRDPNFPNVPSILMTKRHALEEFTPLICSIKILNNNGTVPSTPGY